MAGEKELPWDELASAEIALLEAQRGGDPDATLKAAERWTLCRQECGLIGGLLLVLALEHAGTPVMKKLAAAFDGLARSAWDKADGAEQRATQARDDVDAMRQRIRELERKVDDLTPGVGDPRLRAA